MIYHMIGRTYLENGIPVVYEKADAFRSAVVGIWVRAGSRYEPSELNGISHFIEHMFFKGTSSRSTEDIAKETDAMGADLNAYTSRENTTYYIKVLDEFLDRGIELLCDLFVNSVFDPAEIEKEKGIIEEEIRLSEDTPDDHVFDLFNRNIWGENGLGQTILGTSDTVGTIRRTDIMEYLSCFYTADNMVIALAGNVDIDRAVGMMNERLGGIRGNGERAEVEKPVFVPSLKAHRKDLSEVHVCIGFEGIPSDSPMRYAMLVMNTLLGSGISSRLFQEVREKRGLVYSIHSFLSSYHDAGCFGIYAGSSGRKYRSVIDIIMREACGLKDTLLPEEVERAKNQLKGNILLALESTSARMNNLAKQEIYYGRTYTPGEIIRSIEEVGMDDIRELAAMVFDRDAAAITILGPAEEYRPA